MFGQYAFATSYFGQSGLSDAVQPEAIDIAGTHEARIDITGSYALRVDITGDFLPVIQVTGDTNSGD